MNLYNEAINKSYLAHSGKGQTWGKHKYIAIKNGRYIYPEDLQKNGTAKVNSNIAIGSRKVKTKTQSEQSAYNDYVNRRSAHQGYTQYKNNQAKEAYIKQERSRQINDQIKSAHSNATSSKMDLTPGDVLKKRAEERKAAASSASKAKTDTDKIAEDIKKKNTASVSQPKETAKKEETKTDTAASTSTTSSTTEEKKSGSGKKGSGGSKKGSSSKKSDSTTASTASTAVTPNTSEAKELGLTEDDFKELGLTEAVSTREEAIEKLAMKAIHGDFGNGQDRKTKLGKFYDEVQKKINEIMKDMKSKTTEAKHGDYASDVLCHHGVLGMKWGIRRYQPYPEGHTGGKEVGAAKRERKKLSKEQKAKIKTAAATTAAVATVAGSAAGAAKLYKMDKANAANVKNLSDEELKNANMRAGMEKAYSKNQGRSNLDKAQMLANTTQNTVNQLKNSNRQAMNDAKRNKPRMDLSKMTDQEMRSQINRELLERQYNDLFAPEPVDTGRQKVDKILNTTGDVLAIGSSALMIALAIKSFKG